MTNENKASDPQNDEVYSKADVDKMVKDAISATQASFEAKIKELNNESKNHRLDAKGLKGILAESLGLNEREITVDTLNQKLAEIAPKIEESNSLKTQLDELTKRYNDAEAKATRAVKLNQAKELAEKAGFKSKAVQLMNIDAEDLQAELNRVIEEFPELKKNVEVGGKGATPTQFNSSSLNPYKKESFNLSQQYKLELANPVLAAQFKAEAGIK